MSLVAAYQRISITDDDAARIKDVLWLVFDTLAASSSDERASLTTQKAKLEAEQVKLLQAHYPDAITIDLLKTEQDRIRASLHAITTRLDELATTYDKAKVGLDAILSILTDLGDLYAKAEPGEGRTLNRALFDRITLEDDDTATVTPKQAMPRSSPAIPAPTTNKPCPALMRGRARTFPITWTRVDSNRTPGAGLSGSVPRGIRRNLASATRRTVPLTTSRE